MYWTSRILKSYQNLIKYGLSHIFHRESWNPLIAICVLCPELRITFNLQLIVGSSLAQMTAPTETAFSCLLFYFAHKCGVWQQLSCSWEEGGTSHSSQAWQSLHCQRQLVKTQCTQQSLCPNLKINTCTEGSGSEIPSPLILPCPFHVSAYPLFPLVFLSSRNAQFPPLSSFNYWKNPKQINSLVVRIKLAGVSHRS